MTTAPPVLVLVHGWGLGPDLWDDLCRSWPEAEAVRLDLGFFGPPVLTPALPPNRPVIALGHSLGVLWLLTRQPFAWSALVSINGFDRFTEAPDFHPAVARRPLERMIQRLEQHPATVVSDFRQRCGLQAPVPAEAREAALRDGLLLLRDGDARANLPPAPLLALSAGSDAILPEGMAEACFRGAPRLERRHHPNGGHLLPLTAAGWCSEQIRSFWSGINA